MCDLLRFPMASYCVVFLFLYIVLCFSAVTEIRTVGVGFRIAFDHAVFVAYTRNKTIRNHADTKNGYKIDG